jgi:ADP-heptose:LPS heptosyltransferase
MDQCDLGPHSSIDMHRLGPSRKNRRQWQASVRAKSAFSRFLAFLLIRCLRVGSSGKRKKFAVYKPDGIGDFVLSAEALRVFIDAHGLNNVTLIVSRELVGLAGEIFPGLQILPIIPAHFNWREKLKGLPALRAAVQANAYEKVVCLRHYRTAYDDIILRSLHAARVILLTNQSSVGVRVELAPAPNHFYYVQPDSEARQASEKGVPREWSFHASVLSSALGRSVSPELLLPEWDVYKMREMRGDASPPFMLISPLAGRSIRDLPLPHVQGAARRAFADGLAKFIVTGTRKQSAQLTHYAKALRMDLPGCAVEVAHPPDLPALVRLVASAALILTAETSTAHIAAALDQPALTIIGGGHFGWFAPWRRSARQVWLTHRLPCFNCNWRCPYPEPFCLTRITTAEVEAALPDMRRS